MHPEKDIPRLAKQEELLQFDHFDATTAWSLGSNIKAYCEARGLALTIEIRLAKETVFFYAMPGTGPINADWARRKRNVVDLLQRSSYAVGVGYAQSGGSLEQNLGLPTRDYAAHGGSFPLRIRGVGAVGTVTVSGVPQRQDHAIVVETLADLCGVPLADVALD
jgi:uncharacterized protein (UPF0303 family)